MGAGGSAGTGTADLVDSTIAGCMAHFFFRSRAAGASAADCAGKFGAASGAGFCGDRVTVGFLRIGEWRFWRGLLPGSLLVLFAMLAISVAPAALYSGPEIAAQSLARVGLAGISVWVFFYVAMGPGRMSAIPADRIYWIALASAAFACLDFYYQFPAPAGFGAQYIWLDSGVYRRAQGLFYEASTLGNFCAFFLVMTAVALVRGAANRLVLLLGGAIFAAALVFSYSRSSVLNVAIAIVVLAVMERKRPAVRRAAMLGGGALIALGVVLFRFFPAYAELYWVRLQAICDIRAQFERSRVKRARGILAGAGAIFVRPSVAFVDGRGIQDAAIFGFHRAAGGGGQHVLSVLVETGIVGLLALVVLNFAILREGYRAARSGDAQKSFYGTWIFCFWIAEAAQMMSVDLLTFWRVLPLYLWVLAMAVRR